MNKKFNLTTLVLLVVLFLAGSFYLGMSYQKTKIPTPGTNREAMRGMMNGGDFINSENLANRGMRAGQIIGEVIKINEDSFTIKLNDGGSNTIYITEETTFTQTQKIEKNKLEEGREVVVFGNNQENQSVIAESVQIR